MEDQNIIPFSMEDCMNWYMNGWSPEARLGDAREAAECYCKDQMNSFYGHPSEAPKQEQVQEPTIEEHVELSETLDAFLRDLFKQ